MFVAEATRIGIRWRRLRSASSTLAQLRYPVWRQARDRIQISCRRLNDSRSISQPLARVGYTHLPFGEVDRVYPFFRRT